MKKPERIRYSLRLGAMSIAIATTAGACRPMASYDSDGVGQNRT
jgi:hypothetical protein